MKRMTAVLALLALLACSAVAAEAGKGDGPPPPPFHGAGIVKMADELGLSADQKRKVAQILKDSKAESESMHAAMRAARERLGQVMETSPGDEAAVRAAAREMAKAGEELAVHAGKVKAAVDAVLTPGQRATLAEKKGQFKDRFKGRSEGRGKALDKWIEENLKG